MDEVISRVLTLIPIALLIFLRLFYELSKRKKKAAQSKDRPGLKQTAKDDNLFTALLKRLNGDTQAAAAATPGRVLLHYEESALQAKAVQPARQSARQEQQLVMHPKTEAANAPVLSRPSTQDSTCKFHPLNRERLRQAVLLSEVLGQPRALKPYGAD